MSEVERFLLSKVLKREVVERFLDPEAANWAQFDPELGYTLKPSFLDRDGLDGSYTFQHYEPGGPRVQINQHGETCRLNAYGNSYTQCAQVSDGETWEEYLAAHLGEPIRNYGIGGFGVYQAYLRMRRMESTAQGVPNVILNVFGMDDHLRSLDAWRLLRCGSWFDENADALFHANPWNHVRFDLASGELQEQPSLCPTPESLYRLCDPDFVVNQFRTDPIVLMYLGSQGMQVVLEPLVELAEFLGCIPPDPTCDRYSDQCRQLHLVYGLRATQETLNWSRDWLSARNKELLVLLTHGSPEILRLCQGLPRVDEELVEHVKRGGFRYVDLLEKHADDYACFRPDPEEYLNRYCIPHYNPQGNHFMAYAIKDEIVNWLDPKPPAYRGTDRRVGFAEYLPGVE